MKQTTASAPHGGGLGAAGDRVAVEVSGLRVDLADGSTYVAADVTFSLREGEILGLVGESGCGKTTAALAMLGFARPGTTIVDGRVTIDGVDLLSLSSRELRAQRGSRISYVPQDPPASLNPAIRIGVQLSEVLRAHGERSRVAERLDEMLTEVKLPNDPGFLRRYPHQLSGGQQQRVAIAMAFACRPRVVVLDEPTTGLDVTTQARVLRTVRELCRVHRAAAVYVSHDLAVVGELADRVAVMYLGRLVELGSRETLMRAPLHPYTRRLVSAIPDPKRRSELVGIAGQVEALTERPQGCLFAARCDIVEPECRAAPIARETVRPGHEVACRRWRATHAAGPIVRTVAGGGDAPPAETEGYLAVKGLVAHYGSTQVLHGVDLAVPRGSCVALVGESGSGKTTLAQCIAGLRDRTDGTIRLGGTELPTSARGRSKELRRAVQYVFQNPYGSLNARKSVHQILEQPLRLFWGRRAATEERVAELLRQVSLRPVLAHRAPSQLSGGERQRVAIARALAAEPQLLICDEVTSALDVSVQASILRLIARLRVENGLTVLFVTHNLAIVRAIADQVVVLSQGEIVEWGAVGDVLDRPQADYTKGLLHDTPAFT